MASREAPLPHLLVRDRAQGHAFRPAGGGGDRKIRDVEARTHGPSLRRQLDQAFAAGTAGAAEREPTLQELKAIGVVVVLEGVDPTYPLKIESLQRRSRHRKTPKRAQWLLLSVTPADTETPEGMRNERAMVWVSDDYRAAFVALFERYIEKETPTGRPSNEELVANIGRVRAAVIEDLWQSAGEPDRESECWWEIWLHPAPRAVELLREYAAEHELEAGPLRLRLDERTVLWVRARWSELEDLPFTSVPVSEVRRPELLETIGGRSREDQEELTEDLAERLEACGDRDAPVVCHLDTGVRRTHALLEGSLAPQDAHTAVGDLADRQNHGTPMASLALLGPLEELALGTGTVRLRHRLESVKMLPDHGPGHDPLTYGVVTAQCVALPETVALRRRVFCMPVTAEPDRPGEPTLWSASLDALAAGADIASDADGIALLGAPDPDASRLFVVSAGNVDQVGADYRTLCDTSMIEDPAQAFNALTVGAHTELTGVPHDPSYLGWSPVALAGDISPHSRTSLLFSRRWPIKPDICMEGGNVLTDGAEDFDVNHPVVSLGTADSRDDLAIGSANATSAATAQAARLAALAHATYPGFWPETIRGLIVHAAEWTPTMRSELDGASSKQDRLALLRRYGWGVPTEQTVLRSSHAAVTMVTQDEFVPFAGEEHKARQFRLHDLAWPTEVLRELAEADVTLKVTLSYFIEPTAARRGWRGRYTYPSHGLRFELKGPTETPDELIARVNHESQAEEAGMDRPASTGRRWLIGPQQRNVGSLHQDVWQGSAAELADCGMIAVTPIYGWWKYGKRTDRVDLPVRYALLVSISTSSQDVDLYTPVAVQLQLPIPVDIPAT